MSLTRVNRAATLEAADPPADPRWIAVARVESDKGSEVSV